MSKRPSWCGSYWMPELVRRLASSRFNSACRLHDIHYLQKKLSRDEADKVFLHNMLRQSTHIGDRARAWLYYGAVRAGGWLSWRR